MEANEFVKNHGWEYAKGIVVACESGFLPKNQNYDDLKRLVESHELVETVGGIEKAKHEAYFLTMNVVGFDPTKLERAIADVESCQ